MIDVLVVDDDPIVRESIAQALIDGGHNVAQANDGEQALSLVESRAFDLAVCDVQMPKLDGLTLSRRLRRESPGTAVVIMTSFGKIPDAVSSLRDGALDYIRKPFDPERFVKDFVDSIAERRRQQKESEIAKRVVARRLADDELVGTSMVMRQLVDQISIVAASDASVLVSGAAGTGKSLVARALHRKSPRRNGAIRILPCEFFLRDLVLETDTRALSRLGARELRDEWFCSANGGTLVLDGLETLSPSAQSSLLRVIGEVDVNARRSRERQPLGVRLVSLIRETATELLAGGFSQALFFRLNAMHLHVPSLNEREGDLYELVGYFLRELTPRARRTPCVTPAAWKALTAFEFPDNVRQLVWALEHAVAMAGGSAIDLEHLPDPIRTRASFVSA